MHCIAGLTIGEDPAIPTAGKRAPRNAQGEAGSGFNAGWRHNKCTGLPRHGPCGLLKKAEPQAALCQVQQFQTRAKGFHVRGVHQVVSKASAALIN